MYREENVPQKLANPAKVKEGYPDLATNAGTDYDTFASLRAVSVPAGSRVTFKRVVGKGRSWQDDGLFYNRELPVDGADFRTNSAVKESWNNDGEYLELTVPPRNHRVWRQINALRRTRVGEDVNLPYSEDLKFWEGPAASQPYWRITENGERVPGDWVFPGGKPQQRFDREELRVLKIHGFVSKRKPTKFPDYDPKLNNIVPKDGPYFDNV